jgi:hypothetical protein
MHRLLGAASVLALLSGCNGAVESSESDTSKNALSNPSDSTEAASGGRASGAGIEACLGAFASCVRNGGDERQCFDTLRACAPPPGDRPSPGGEPCEDGPRPPGEPPPPPPPPGDFGEYDGERLPPPPPPPCMELLIACAKGTDALEICVERAVGCFEAARSAPPPPPSDGDEAPRPPEPTR